MTDLSSIICNLFEPKFIIAVIYTLSIYDV